MTTEQVQMVAEQVQIVSDQDSSALESLQKKS